MKYFTKEFIDFFGALAKNNSKEWFERNRSTYEEQVKKPFELFLTQLIHEMAKTDKAITLTAKEATFRINKDIRFSKDKSPYKTFMSAAISSNGRNPEYPGLYLECNHKKIKIIVGLFAVDRDTLTKVRNYIGNNLATFQRLTHDQNFKKHFGILQGEKSKILPPQIKLLVLEEPLLANKQFYATAELPASRLTSINLLAEIMQYHRAAKPVNDFMLKAIQ